MLDPYPITIVALVVIVLAVLVTRLLRDPRQRIARLGVFIERDDAQERSASSPERPYDDGTTWSTDDAPTGVRPLGRDEARARIPRRNRDVEQ